mmetsp:Transcript_32536/g.45133  ORF Transcript_32536/g.45133 Transcript_32536/m.45133 type:complete len:231 (+) Transcript_32536:487-1179(+)
MVLSINKRGPKINHWETSQGSSAHHLLKTLEDSGNVLLGDGSTLDLRDELKSDSILALLEVNGDVGVLSRSSGLFFVGVLDGYGLGDALSVINLGSSNIALYLKLAAKTVNDDFQMELSHSFDDGLVGLLIARVAEGGILLSKLVKSGSQLLQVSLGLGLNGNLDDGVGEIHLLQDNGELFVRESLSRDGVLQSSDGNDVSSTSTLHILTIVGVHLKNSSNALFLALAGV